MRNKIRNILQEASKGEGKRKRIFYHCAPQKVRASIERYGIDPSRSKHRWDESESGFYALNDLDVARWYANQMANTDPKENFDIWKIQLPDDVSAFPDETLMIGGDEYNTNADTNPSYYIEAPISKKYVLGIVDTINIVDVPSINDVIEPDIEDYINDGYSFDEVYDQIQSDWSSDDQEYNGQFVNGEPTEEIVYDIYRKYSE